MFIQTETTPNPMTMKFLPGRPVLEGEPREMRNKEEASASPLATALFSIDDISNVFLGKDFIAVTKSSGEWAHLLPAILAHITDHFVSERPLLRQDHLSPPADEDEFFAPEDAAIVSQIKDILETRIRPAVAQDGGDITFKGFRDGIVYVSLKGACSNCPSSTATLRYSVQNLLKHFLPNITSVEPLS